jgi:hypothetical protein
MAEAEHQMPQELRVGSRAPRSSYCQTKADKARAQSMTSQSTSGPQLIIDLDHPGCTLQGRCLHPRTSPLYLVWRVPFSGESIHC